MTRKKSFKKEVKEDWLVTYSDSITLLMAFFVVLLSISTIDQSKVERMQAGLNADLLKAEHELPFSTIETKLKHLLMSQRFKKDITVSQDSLGLRVDFKSEALFESGTATLKKRVYPILEKIALTVKESSHKNVVIKVEGHTDNTPISTSKFASNWELSAVRATAVLRYFYDKGIDPELLTATGYADTFPMVPNNTKEGRAKNRRIEFVLEKMPEKDAAKAREEKAKRDQEKKKAPPKA